jgi:hypothetical protein
VHQAFGRSRFDRVEIASDEINIALERAGAPE